MARWIYARNEEAVWVVIFLKNKEFRKMDFLECASQRASKINYICWYIYLTSASRVFF